MEWIRALRGLSCKRLQADEIWSFVGAKAKNVTPAQQADGWGDVWTWTAIDADTKLVPTWWVGGRTATDALEFMDDVAARIDTRVQLTTDGLNSYLVAVDRAFEGQVDYPSFTRFTAMTRSLRSVTAQRVARALRDGLSAGTLTPSTFQHRSLRGRT